MADDLSKQLEAALSRIAAMESEMAPLRKGKESPQKQFDPNAFVRSFVADPIGMMAKMGVPKDHVTKILVADALGDEAPPELKMARQMGHQINSTSDLTQKLDELSRRIEALSDKDARQGTRESINKLVGDKAKYPHLAAALAKDPSLFDDDIASHKGSAEELVQSLEARTAKYAGALGAKVALPASGGNAEGTAPREQNGKPAWGSSMDVPPIPQKQQGVWSEEDDQALRDEITSKYGSDPTRR
jgi:hypothetical protein